MNKDDFEALDKYLVSISNFSIDLLENIWMDGPSEKALIYGMIHSTLVTNEYDPNRIEESMLMRS
jgi:hypothetical protein